MNAGPQQPRETGHQHEFNERDAIDAALIRLYRLTREPRRLEGLLVRFEPLLVSVVGGYARSDEAFDDVLQFALLGLLRALETYERSSGVGFATFARSAVVAEIDRRSSDAPHAARTRRARKALQRRALDVRRLHPAIGDDDLAARLGVPVDELLDAQQIRPARLGPIDPAGRTTGTADAGGAPQHPELEHVDLEDEVDVSLAILGPRDVEALPLRFVEDQLLCSLCATRTDVVPIDVLRVLNRALGRVREVVEANLGAARHDDPTLPAR